MRIERHVVACALATAVLVGAAGAGASGRPERTVNQAATATERARRFAPTVIEYDVFGDSITVGYGVAPHLTWVAWLAHHLAVTEPAGVAHRFFNHAIAGQAISTRSFLAVDPANASLQTHLVNFFADPPRSTPIADRYVVLVPSINELILSDRGPSGEARIARAEEGIRDAMGYLAGLGIPRTQVVLLPMPPIGVQFAESHAHTSDVDVPLPRMIAEVNRRLADLLAVPGYALLDPEGDGLADASAYDDVGDEHVSVADGLHLDPDGHALIGRAVAPLFAT